MQTLPLTEAGGGGSKSPPQYRSHKLVQALPISSATDVPDSSDVELTFAEDYAPFRADQAMIARYRPQPGDYLVLYDDGYKSISPRGVFEEGYSAVGSATDDAVREPSAPDAPALADSDRGLLHDMAHVGHSVTERGADLLRRLLYSSAAVTPFEYPKMIYPEGMEHDRASEPHLIGKPKGFIVHDREEEDRVSSMSPEELGTLSNQAGHDPMAVRGAQPEEYAVALRIENERRETDIDHSANAMLGGTNPDKGNSVVLEQRAEEARATDAIEPKQENA